MSEDGLEIQVKITLKTDFSEKMRLNFRKNMKKMIFFLIVFQRDGLYYEKKFVVVVAVNGKGCIFAAAFHGRGGG